MKLLITIQKYPTQNDTKTEANPYSCNKETNVLWQYIWDSGLSSLSHCHITHAESG